MNAVGIVAVTAAVTILLRFLPFAVFRGGRRTPEFIAYLGRTLPCAIMGMLIVYCLRNVSVTAPPFGAPELLGVLCVAGLYAWRRNTLLSIGLGTAIYMVLVQVVFR